MTDQEVEAVARAITELDRSNFRDVSYPWGKFKTREGWHAALARAAIAALDQVRGK